MNNSFFLQQIPRTGNLDSKLISRRYTLNLTADFMRNTYENPRLEQSEIANQLGYSTSTLQRYRNDINILSPYRIQPNSTDKRTKNPSNTNSDNNSHSESDVKRPRLSSNDLKRPQLISESSAEVTPVKSKKIEKCCK